jgi:hypothetical protein
MPNALVRRAFWPIGRGHPIEGRAGDIRPAAGTAT